MGEAAEDSMEREEENQDQRDLHAVGKCDKDLCPICFWTDPEVMKDFGILEDEECRDAEQ